MAAGLRTLSIITSLQVPVTKILIANKMVVILAGSPSNVAPFIVQAVCMLAAASLQVDGQTPSTSSQAEERDTERYSESQSASTEANKVISEVPRRILRLCCRSTAWCYRKINVMSNAILEVAAGPPSHIEPTGTQHR